jgi:hypothetical protein
VVDKRDSVKENCMTNAVWDEVRFLYDALT